MRTPGLVVIAVSLLLAVGCSQDGGGVSPSELGTVAVSVPKAPSHAADQGPPEAWELAASPDVRAAALGRALLHRYRE